MRILALCTFPVEAATTRFRVQQFVGPLAECGIEVDLKPFLSGNQFRSLYRGGAINRLAGMLGSIAKRVGEISSAGRYDLLFVQREAMPFGPAVFERLFQAVGRMPMVLDLDDATYVRYVSPTYGRLGSALKFFGKTDKLIDRSEAVICGNRYIAEYVEGRGAKAVVIPTIVDTDVFRPREESPEGVPLTLGWIGTHSTYQFLKRLFPVLERLAEKHRFRLKVVGAGVDRIDLDGVEVDALDWSLDREISDFQSLDIGLYPLETEGSLHPAWLAGKSGFKAIQYLAVGIPFVMSPVGVCAEIGEPGKTHFNAASDDDWYNSLERLLSDHSLRSEMGKRGREVSLSEYDVDRHVETLAEALRTATKRRAA